MSSERPGARPAKKPPARIYTWGLPLNLIRVYAQKVPPRQVLAMWKMKWLKEKPHLKVPSNFLTRPEVIELSKMPHGTVRRAIDVDPRLKVILEAAKNPTPRPKTTSAQYPENVWITTSSGGAFHKGKNCAALRRGQRIVSNQGGTPAPVIAVQYKQAKARGTEPCQACFPPNRKR